MISVICTKSCKFVENVVVRGRNKEIFSECVFSAGKFLVVKSLRGDAAGFSVEDSVVFPWDQGLSRVPVGNSGRVLTFLPSE